MLPLPVLVVQEAKKIAVEISVSSFFMMLTFKKAKLINNG